MGEWSGEVGVRLSGRSRLFGFPFFLFLLGSRMSVVSFSSINHCVALSVELRENRSDEKGVWRKSLDHFLSSCALFSFPSRLLLLACLTDGLPDGRRPSGGQLARTRGLRSLPSCFSPAHSPPPVPPTSLVSPPPPATLWLTCACSPSALVPYPLLIRLDPPSRTLPSLFISRR